MLTSHLKLFHYPAFIRAQTTGKRLFSVGRIAWTDMERYYSDPDYRRQNLDRKIHEERLRKAKDPAFHAKKKAYLKEDARRRRTSETHVRKALLNSWVRRPGWRRSALPWKKYRPELFSEKVSHHCSGCNRPDHRTKLWWSWIDSEKLLCGICWFKLSWEESCPRGFEDTAAGREFTARAKDLGYTK